MMQMNQAMMAAMFAPRPPPKNPTPAPMDIAQIMAAAQAHVQMRNSEAPMIQTPDGAIPEDEIPLPPLPAAADKDPAALMDTRPPQEPTPPPPTTTRPQQRLRPTPRTSPCSASTPTTSPA